MEIPEEPLAALSVRQLGQVGHRRFATGCYGMHEITTLTFIERQLRTFVVFMGLGKRHHQTPAS
jgi:hypothetical protein